MSLPLRALDSEFVRPAPEDAPRPAVPELTLVRPVAPRPSGFRKVVRAILDVLGRAETRCTSELERIPQVHGDDAPIRVVGDPRDIYLA